MKPWNINHIFEYTAKPQLSSGSIHVCVPLVRVATEKNEIVAKGGDTERPKQYSSEFLHREILIILTPRIAHGFGPLSNKTLLGGKPPSSEMNVRIVRIFENGNS